MKELELRAKQRREINKKIKEKLIFFLKKTKKYLNFNFRHQEIVEQKKIEKKLEEEKIKEEDKLKKLEEIARYKQKKREVMNF